MKIDISANEVLDFYEENDCIFISPSDFKVYIHNNDKIKNEEMPNFLVAGEALIFNLKDLIRIARKGSVYIQRYKLTYKEGGYWTAIPHYYKDLPHGDLMSKGKRLSGSYGSKS